MHSTTTALLETKNNWSINIDNGLLNGVLFIDLKKAFDTIDHEIILQTSDVKVEVQASPHPMALVS